jgi:hypothetical protein
MQKAEFRDRRAYERIPARLFLRYLNLDSDKEGSAQTRDISANGIGLFTEEELLPHTILEIWLHIPDRGEPLYTKGEVVWSKMIEPNRYRSGVHLEKVDFMAMARIVRLQNITTIHKTVY